MDKDLKKYHLPKTDTQKHRTVNSPISAKEIETVLKHLPTKKYKLTWILNWTLINIWGRK